MRTFLLCTVILLIYGCTHTPELTNIEAAPRAIPPVSVDLAAYQAPQTIGPFTLQGDMAASGNPSRLFRYTSSNAGQTLSIVIYPLPGGWEQMDADQQIAGHYGQVRQDAVKQLIKRGATRVDIENEKTYVDPDSQALTAESSIIATSSAGTTVTQTLMLRRSGPIFIRLGLIDSEKVNNIALARSTLNTFVNTVAAPSADTTDSLTDNAR
ncbi:MAG: hypothetical protein KBT87_02755 [Gammaproteobacteria bacterium]|jgi:hypothetical protein|nr:hypothetical protein [Gammaproteobacteria bacterium]MBQ0773571.1 hypothetical protein [Gammaproteobacteria bacterium]